MTLTLTAVADATPAAVPTCTVSSHDPVVGVIFARDRHPAAKCMADVEDPGTLAMVLCDDHLPLSEALTREWDQDAHFILYTLTDEDGASAYFRAAKRAPLVAELIQRGGRVDVRVLALDHDLPKERDLKQSWSEESLGEFVQGLAQADLPRPTYWYTTLHGSRFVYVLTTPVDHLRAEAMLTALMDQFAARGIAMDRARSDWTGLYRLPRAKREDTAERYDSLIVGPGEALDPTTINVQMGAQPAPLAALRPHDAPMPSADEAHALLFVPDARGRERQTDFFREAKNMLKGREGFAACFEDGKVDVSDGWNTGVTRLVGQVVAMTARIESATPEAVYALIRPAVEQLQAEEDVGAQETDWYETSWDLVCRMWAVEQAQVEAEHRERERALLNGKAVRGGLVDMLRAELPEQVPAEKEEAETWLRQRMIASDGQRHHVMRADGSYNVKPVSDSMLLPMIRELGMEDVIETYEMRGKSWVSRSAQSILNDSAIPISTLTCSSRDKVAYIDGDPGHRTLHIPVHRLNPKVKPRPSARVEEWLECFFGAHVDSGLEWLSWAPEVASPICALNLYGASGTGKGMLAQGLAECFEGERVNDGRALGKYNEGLLHSPVVTCDEGLPQTRSDESLPVDQAFRSFVSGGSIIIRSMYMNPFNAQMYPRILFTGNDRDIIRSIVGHRDLTDEDVRAIEMRLLSIEVSGKARDFLTSRGNYKYTAGWIHGKAESRYELAGHILWLHQQRKPALNGSGRLLVEGDVHTSLVRSMRLRTGASQAVLRALVKMIEAPMAYKGLVIEGDVVWVTAAAVVDYVQGPLSGIVERISLSKAGAVLRQFAVGEHAPGTARRSRPVGSARGRWVQVDLAVLLEEGLRYGLGCERVELLLRRQDQGAERATAAHARQDYDD